MPVDISATGDDTAIRISAEKFAETFRNALLKRATTLLSHQSEALFAGVVQELEALASAHEAGLARLKELSGQVPSAAPERLRVLVEEYYATAYELFQHSRSAGAFYQLSESFLRVVTSALVMRSARELALTSEQRDGIAILALGPAGRHEFSPFCRIQLLLVVDQADSALVESVGRRLHDAFVSIGLRPDKQITPRNPEWRGTPAQWRSRIESGLRYGEEQDLIRLLRLADLAVLHDTAETGDVFRRECFKVLQSSRSALINLVERIQGLGTGTLLLGGVRLVNHGPHAGTFRLLDHALLPLSASVAALSLMLGTDETGIPRRIRALRAAGWLDATLAGQLREAWHLFNELRLVIELREQPHWLSHDLLYLAMNSCSDQEQLQILDLLKALEHLQELVGNSLSHWEEQLPC